MLPIFPPIEQSSLGVAMHWGGANTSSIFEIADAMRLAEGEIVAGQTEKSKVKPRPVSNGEGSRTHFFHCMMNPAFIEVWMRTSLEEIAWPKEGLAPRPSST